VHDVTGHTGDASHAALPAWSLPKDAVDLALRVACERYVARLAHFRDRALVIGMGVRQRDGAAAQR